MSKSNHGNVSIVPFVLISVICCCQSFFGFGSSVDIEIVLDGQETRKTAEIKHEDGRKERCYLYLDGETVSGKVRHLYRTAVA